ncbi:calpain 12 (predicted), isoform CRA_a [Rattus norvegicus]|uniref:Calpain 12 (Predicted), isoform CRA_a n=1 Tax=Rattus norvegicus TaxID=10116 RepID=A6J9L9_RAT|nr:calpain 12 (predicted), isoform CRA_a [Rattus norvegicus]EDM07865.1 calpain 12 (predicted), isoform CRA_a [Rattus norvegicus]
MNMDELGLGPTCCHTGGGYGVCLLAMWSWLASQVLGLRAGAVPNRTVFLLQLVHVSPCMEAHKPHTGTGPVSTASSLGNDGDAGRR